MNFAELRALAVSAGFPDNSDADTAAAIALAESGGNPAAVGDNGTSFGLWQVHTPAWPQFDPNSLLDPTYNANAAFTIFKARGGDFTDWSTFTSADPNVSYLRFMPAGVATIKKAWPTVKTIGIILASSVVVAEIIKHGGVGPAWRAAGRTMRRYV